MSKFARKVVIVLGSLLITSCTHIEINQDYQKHTVNYEALEDIRAEFKAIKNTHFAPKLVEIEKRTGYQVDVLDFENIPSDLRPDEDHTIRVSYYRPENTAGKNIPVVMVMPILGGNYFVSINFSHYFAKRGLAVVLVHRQKKYKKFSSFGDINKLLKQTVKDHIYVLDWIEQKDDLDHNKIASLGVSMGSIKNCLVTAIDGRIKASVMALTGGDLPAIFCQTTERNVRNERNKILAERNIDIEELQRQLNVEITMNPIRFASSIDRDKALIVLAKYDKTVPYKLGLELLEKIGYPEHILLKSGHITSAVYIPYLKEKSYEFIKKKLHLD